MIVFSVIDATFNLQHKIAIKNWIKEIISAKNLAVGDINYIFSNDDYVLDINRTYLSHDYYTDIITFDTSGYSQRPGASGASGKISADIFISLDTVAANAAEYGTSFSRELYRVIIHGVLHLIGYDDLTPEQSLIMHRAEDSALELLDRYGIASDQKYISCRV